MIIDVQHVTWKRGPHTLLNDVSWQVNDGERWAVRTCGIGNIAPVLKVRSRNFLLPEH